jgi:peroxiredoxin
MYNLEENIMTIQVGEKIPSVTLQQMQQDGPADITTEQLFDGKKVVVFALPGAYTPTCSASHLPGYVVKSDELFAKGVDSIICMAVNDAFVMGAWGEQHNADDRVMMIADGSAKFASAVGLELDLIANGMGIRSQRYAMVVNNGIVETLNVEEAGKFEVSDADTILKSL